MFYNKEYSTCVLSDRLFKHLCCQMAGYLTYFYILWEGGSTGKIIFINKLNKGLEKIDEMNRFFPPPYLTCLSWH